MNYINKNTIKTHYKHKLLQKKTKKKKLRHESSSKDKLKKTTNMNY